MPRVQISSYSKFYHAETGAAFHPVLDQRTGCYVGIADVDTETAEKLAGNAAFQILSDEEFADLSEKPAEPEPEPSQTGDPLTDKATAPAKSGPQSGPAEPIDLSGPPAPESK